MFPTLQLKTMPDFTMEGRIVANALEEGSYEALDKLFSDMREWAEKFARNQIPVDTGQYHEGFEYRIYRSRGKVGGVITNKAPDAAIQEYGRTPGETPMPAQIMIDYLKRRNIDVNDPNTSFIRPIRITVKTKRGGTYTKTVNKRVTAKMRVRSAVLNAAEKGHPATGIFGIIRRSQRWNDQKRKIEVGQRRALRRKGKIK